MQLVIQLHPHQYPNGPIQVGLIGILLLHVAFFWLSPLLEHQLLYLYSITLKHSFQKNYAIFGDLNQEHTSTNKL
jgi:hypothetical protein